MSTTAKSNSNTTEVVTSISEAEDMKMFQAARRNGRRNALGDLGEQLAQGQLKNIFFFKKENFHFSCFSSWQFKFIF